MTIVHCAHGPCLPLLGLVRPYTKIYANRHGYRYMSEEKRTFGRHPYWMKLRCIIEALLEDAEVLYMDVDTVVACPEQPICIETGPCGLGMCFHGETEPHYNVGVIHARRAALPYLEAAWRRYPTLHRWPEQMALNYELRETGAEVKTLDHSRNECNAAGNEPTQVKAWHGVGSYAERLELMRGYMIENSLWRRAIGGPDGN